MQSLSSRSSIFAGFDVSRWLALVDPAVAAVALRSFLDEALRLSNSVEVTEP